MADVSNTARRIVPIEEAIRRLRVNARGEVHTFMQALGVSRLGATLLVGADHAVELLIEVMRQFEVEEAGEAASALGHTLVVARYRPASDGQPNPLFIEAWRPDEAAPSGY